MALPALLLLWWAAHVNADDVLIHSLLHIISSSRLLLDLLPLLIFLLFIRPQQQRSVPVPPASNARDRTSSATTNCCVVIDQVRQQVRLVNSCTSAQLGTGHVCSKPQRQGACPHEWHGWMQATCKGTHAGRQHPLELPSAKGNCALTQSWGSPHCR
jgi:hypothetical protein